MLDHERSSQIHSEGFLNRDFSRPFAPESFGAERGKLMRRVQTCGFAIAEAALYLDSHPEDKAALEYYHKYRKLRDAAVNAYEENFGPMSQDANRNEDRWQWADGPWPWEKED